MINRQFCYPLLAVLGLSSSIAGVRMEASDQLRPNILWLVTEDNGPNYVQGYGDWLARTPNIDTLIKHGIVFDRAYASAPVCAPSRSSIITGRHAFALGTEDMRSQSAMPPEIRFFPEYLREAGYFCSNQAKTDYNTSRRWDETWDESSSTAHWRGRAPGQPFFAVFNFFDSHEQHLHKRYPHITDPGKVRVPAYLPDTPEVRADIAQYYDRVSLADEQIGAVLKQLKEDGLADNTIIFYYSDHGGVLPRSKRFLYEAGCKVPLIVRFPRRYADLAPSANDGRNTELVNLVDLAPTLLSLVGLPIPKIMQGRAFAGSARSAPPAVTFSARGRMDERLDLSRAVTDGRFRYIRNFRPYLANGQILEYLWRSASMQSWWKLHRAGALDATAEAFFQARSPEELYDSERDPDNVVNLVDQPAFAAERDRLRHALRDEMLRVRDPGFIPAPMMERLFVGQSPAIVARDTEFYPLTELLATIDRLQLGQPDSGDIAEALSNPSPLFRYWGLVAALSVAPMPDARALLVDPDPVVRLMAAETVLRGHDAMDESAWIIVQAALGTSEPPMMRLAAGNVVADFPNAPKAAGDALQFLTRYFEPAFGDYAYCPFEKLVKDREWLTGEAAPASSN